MSWFFFLKSTHIGFKRVLQFTLWANKTHMHTFTFFLAIQKNLIKISKYFSYANNTSMAPKECTVCIENFNKSKRKPIVCLHCSFEACSSCVSRVLLESNNEPRCMNCAHVWSREFIVENFTKKFVNKNLKTHRENQLLDRERAMLPATQPIVERAMEKQKLTEQAQKIKAQIADLKLQLATVQQRIRAPVVNEEVMTKEKREFVRRCPAGDCRGFLSTTYKCGICDTWTCPSCHEPKGTTKDAPHACKPENVETVKRLAKDTKSCPKCAVPIHRIHGCAQMFCTCCHTTFNWNTLKIETGIIHNPHYFEMLNRLRQQGENADDVDLGCNGMPDIRAISRIFTPTKDRENKRQEIYEYIRWMEHINLVERRRYRIDGINDNLDIRVKYLMNDITDLQFKRILQQREKAREKKQEIDQILVSVYTISADIIRSMLGNLDTTSNSKVISNTVKTAMCDIKQLLILSNEGMAKIEKKYDCQAYQLDFKFKE